MKSRFMYMKNTINFVRVFVIIFLVMVNTSCSSSMPDVSDYKLGMEQHNALSMSYELEKFKYDGLETNTWSAIARFGNRHKCPIRLIFANDRLSVLTVKIDVREVKYIEILEKMGYVRSREQLFFNNKLGLPALITFNISSNPNEALVVFLSRDNANEVLRNLNMLK